MSHREPTRVTIAVVALLILAVEPGLAQESGDGGSALGDAIVWAITEALRLLFAPIESVIRDHADELVGLVVETPVPDAVFERPTNAPWPGLYDYYWETLVPLSLFVWSIAVGLVILLESTSFLFSSYHRSKLKKRAFSGLLGILAWWWMDALARGFIDSLSLYLVPDLSQVTLFETLSFSSMSVLGVVLALFVDFILFGLVALIYVLREVVLYLFTLLMPLLIAFWVPGVGPFSLVSKMMKRLAGFYVPFLFMTVPVAVLFRLGGLLGEHATLSMGGIGAWLSALVIPVIAVVSPFVLFWQAGALFFMADRAAHHASSRQARRRANRMKATAETGALGGQNLARGLRGNGAVQPDGTTVFGSGDSRANRAGIRLRSRVQDTGERLGSFEFSGSNSTSATSDSAASVTREHDGATGEASTTQQTPRTDGTVRQSNADETNEDDR